MINPFGSTSDGGPKVGDEIVTPIAQSSQRVSILPDQTLIVSAPHFVELVLLRSEWVPMRQKLMVTAVEENGATLSGGAAEGQFQVFDVGHIRFGIDAGLETGINLLAHLVGNGRVTKDDLIARISAAIGE